MRLCSARRLPPAFPVPLNPSRLRRVDPSETAALASAPMAGHAAQQQGLVTAPWSPPRGAPGFVAVAAPKQAMEAPPSSSPQGAPGFAVVPQGGANAAAPDSPQGPPGFWLAPQQGAPAPQQGATVMVTAQGATVMAPQQQHFASVMLPASQDGMQMAVKAASMGMMMASMPLQLQAQAQAMAAHQQAQCMVPSQSLSMCPPMTEMQQAQAGHMMATPPLPLGPPPLMQQQQQLSQADPGMMAQPPLPLGPPPMILQQQPAQGGAVMMAQPPLAFSSPSVLQQQQHQHPQGNQMMVGQPQLSALPCKRQRVDQYGLCIACDSNNPYGQHMTGHQQETAMFNAATGQSLGTNLPTGFPSFGASMPSLPTDATSTVYVEGIPSNCTRREVARNVTEEVFYL
nr:unnamed protein product [Digitaria exilis]